ncbi:nSTAND1 domain-containing NTPase [Anthocerotibacter panamensis]|uniref:nSTAND1 domain-containing NTPase n=1 Tax=Anthocerotibacter panamensis TaxID=2857077 RepID=UPI001C4084CD|nr:caspase family protein [Anthocerotibacter panamensis]
MSPVSVATSRSTHGLESGEARLWCLLIGVNQYQTPELPSLKFCAADCEGLSDALQEATRSFPERTVFIHHDFTAGGATLRTVAQSLQEIIYAAQPQDTVLIYFSGHGVLHPVSQQAVLCLSDTYVEDLSTTGLGILELMGLLEQCRAYQQLVWLDACHSGGMTLRTSTEARVIAPSLTLPTGPLVAALRQHAARSKGFHALLSCDQDQRSWAFPELGHGVFTYFLMRGLRGAAADERGMIAADGLYRYVYHETLHYIDRFNQQQRLINQQLRSRGEVRPEYSLQTPKKIVELVGELVIGRAPTQPEGTNPRWALVVEGYWGAQAAIALGRLLSSAGGYRVQYWPPPNMAPTLRQVIHAALAPRSSTAVKETTFLYLRGRIEETPEGESWLVVGDGLRLSRTVLRQELRRAGAAKQIVVLDCPGAVGLADWIEDLRLEGEQGQCLIAAACPVTDPDCFAQALFRTLECGDDPQVGLSVTGWIGLLEQELAGLGIPLHLWLTGAQGVIEVLPGGRVRAAAPAPCDLDLCPYMGLRAFTERDAPFFYGRDDLIQRLVTQVRNHSFLAVVGASGSGKSSVVQAGLMAQLRQGKQILGAQEWWVKSFRPGARPLDALAWRLVDAGREQSLLQHEQIEGLLHLGVEGLVRWLRTRPEPMVVLVVDQFEEVFTLAATQERQAFLDLLLGALQYAADRFKLVLTLRADSLAPCLEYPALAQQLQRSSILVPPGLSKEEYRAVIRQPAQQVGLEVEPELLEVLLADLNPSAGDLPLLEFVLAQLWEHRTGVALTLRAYQEQIGGIQGALERKADAVYQTLDSEARDCARWIFMNLIQLGEGTEDTRRRVLRSRLEARRFAPELVHRTLDALTTAKLLVLDLPVEVVPQSRGTDIEVELAQLQQEVTVEVAHEILIRSWATLREWLAENRASLRSQRQIEQAASLWQCKNRESDYLLRGTHLAEAEKFYIEYADRMSPAELAFMDASLQLRDQEQALAKQRLRQAHRVAGVMGVLAVAALGLGGVAYWQSLMSQEKQAETLIASAQLRLASYQQLDALVDSVQAQHLVQQTWTSPPELRTAATNILQEAVYTNQESNRLEGHENLVSRVSFSPDGATLATSSWDQTIRLWRPDGSLIKVLHGHEGIVASVCFSPDGQTLASANSDHTIRLWNQDGQLLKVFSGHMGTVWSVNFSPDGRSLVSASEDKTVRLWSRTGKLLKVFRGHADQVLNASFSPDGQTIASASWDGTIRLWKLDGTLLRTLKGHRGGVWHVTFSPDGTLLASASQDQTVRLWQLDGTLLQTLQGHSAPANSVAFSPDGRTLASGSEDKTIRLWGLDGTLLTILRGHTAGVFSLSFSPDGKVLASASDDRTIRLWNLKPKFLNARSSHDRAVTDLSFSPDGQTLASSSQDTTIRLWREDGSLQKTIPNPAAVMALTHQPGGSLVSAGLEEPLRLWSPAGQPLGIFPNDKLIVKSLSSSPDGHILASTGPDALLRLWHKDGTLLKTISLGGDRVARVRVSPDGKTLATGGWDGNLRLWSREGKLLHTFKGHTRRILDLSFSPDGMLLASASEDKTIRLWKKDGTLLAVLIGHTDQVSGVSFHPNGQILASASLDKTVRLWNLAGQPIATLYGHPDGVRVLRFSPDGKTLVSGSGTGSLFFWQAWQSDADQLLQEGCSLLGDYLKTNPKSQTEPRRICLGS